MRGAKPEGSRAKQPRGKPFTFSRIQNHENPGNDKKAFDSLQVVQCLVIYTGPSNIFTGYCPVVQCFGEPSFSFFFFLPSIHSFFSSFLSFLSFLSFTFFFFSFFLSLLQRGCCPTNSVCRVCSFCWGTGPWPRTSLATVFKNPFHQDTKVPMTITDLHGHIPIQSIRDVNLKKVPNRQELSVSDTKN
jgi:hypothetical protein